MPRSGESGRCPGWGRRATRSTASEYRRLADDYFEVEKYTEFCATSLAHVDDLMLDWIASAEFDTLLVETVRATYPAHEQEQFLAHFRGLMWLWLDERGRAPRTA